MDSPRANNEVDGCRIRKRHMSDSNLPLSPLSDTFAQKELEEYLNYFKENKIPQWKIYQHITGSRETEEGRSEICLMTKLRALSTLHFGLQVWQSQYHL